MLLSFLKSAQLICRRLASQDGFLKMSETWLFGRLSLWILILWRWKGWNKQQRPQPSQEGRSCWFLNALTHGKSMVMKDFGTSGAFSWCHKVAYLPKCRKALGKVVGRCKRGTCFKLARTRYYSGVCTYTFPRCPPGHPERQFINKTHYFNLVIISCLRNDCDSH